MISKSVIEERFYVVKEYCAKYRKELTVFGGVISEKTGAISCKDYVEFMNQLTFQEFSANYCTCLLNDVAFNNVKKLNNGEMLFDDYARTYLSSWYDDYCKAMED
jgi:thiaminase